MFIPLFAIVIFLLCVILIFPLFAVAISGTNASHLIPPRTSHTPSQAMGSDTECDYEVADYGDEHTGSYESGGGLDNEDRLEQQHERYRRSQVGFERQSVLQAERTQNEEQDFDDYLDQQAQWAQKEEQDFEDYMERRDQRAEKDAQEFERILDTVRARKAQQDYTDWLGEKKALDHRNLDFSHAPVARTASAPRPPPAGSVKPNTTCTICCRAPIDTVLIPCGHPVGCTVLNPPPLPVEYRN